ncbi:MAG: cytochrome c [Planctomycetaceae bacterium]
MQADTYVRSPRGGLRVAAWAALGAALLAAGCSRTEPQFASRAEVHDLMPEARQYVHEVLDQNFGTPTNSIAWERMPVHFHAATGTIATIAADNRASITLVPPAIAGAEEPTPGAFEQYLPIRSEVRNDDGHLVQPGSEVLVISKTAPDGAADQAIWVKSFDEATQAVVLSAPLPEQAAASDRVIIGPGAMLKHGRMLYAEHCQHCHGVSGDGNGPTAQYLSPLPRDYRKAIFKFTSTGTTFRAQRSDLARIIEAGIPGTYMPSFKLLKPDESKALVEYVMWLACRGETELRRAQALESDYSMAAAKENPAAAQAGFAELFSQFATDFDDETNDVAAKWNEANQSASLVTPKANRTPSTPESIARGREIFKSASAKCSTCHGEAAKGDGPQTLFVQPDAKGKPRDLPGLFDDWNNPIRPRDLTSGIYRGGRRPVDIYRRIFAGIKGTPMTGFGATLSEEQLWDLVNYVLSVPFEHRTPGSGPFPSEGAAKPVASKDSGSGVEDSGVAPSSGTTGSVAQTESR